MGWFSCCNCCCWGKDKSKEDMIFLISGINDAGKTTFLHRLLNGWFIVYNKI